MAKKKKDECPPQGAPAWMVTYGDMMTLLLTFFVLIVSFSSIEQVKFRAAISSIQEGLGIWPDQAGIMREIQLMKDSQKAQDAAMIIQELAEYLQRNNIADLVEIYNTPMGVRMIIADPLMFRSGSADLRTEFEEFLQKVSAIIKDKELAEVQVEGHTDNVPINTARFPSNWELSGARALAVVKFMAFQGGLDPAKLSAVGYGEYRPRATNDSPEGRARNRRVEIFLEQKVGDTEVLEF